jgi:hypothetical protein
MEKVSKPEIIALITRVLMFPLKEIPVNSKLASKETANKNPEKDHLSGASSHG